MPAIKNKRALEGDEQGFAAIVVALVLILVLCLMTVGFAQLMNSNQESALNKQLSDQAYYAAESGINDAAQAYAAGYTLPKTGCQYNADTSSTNTADVDQDEPGYQYLSQPSVNTSTATGVSCLLTDPTPNSLLYTVYPNQPTVAEMQGCSAAPESPATPACGAGGATAISTININWQDVVNDDDTTAPQPATQDPTCSTLSPEQSNGNGQGWPYQNMLRIMLVPIGTAANGLSRSDLINDSYTAFLCPDGVNPSNEAPHLIAPGNIGNSSGEILSSHCQPDPGSNGADPPNVCSVSLNVSQFNDTDFFIIMRGVYNNPVQANISMYNGSTLLNIANAQLVVDATGKAQNILRRIEVRVPETNEYNMPIAAVQGEICKQLGIMPNSTYTYNTSTDESPCNDIRSEIPSP